MDEIEKKRFHNGTYLGLKAESLHDTCNMRIIIILLISFENYIHYYFRLKNLLIN